MLGAHSNDTVIADPATLRAVQEGWEFVRNSRNVAVGNCNVAVGVIGFNQLGMRDLCFNLILASAYSVLEEVLEAFRHQGIFTSGRRTLGEMMHASSSVLPWVDWALIDAGRTGRNASIHDRVFLPHDRCRDLIAAIENELVAWKILDAPTPELWHW